MIAILGGLGAAVAWCASTVCSSRSTRMIGPASVVAWVALAGLLLTRPFGLHGRRPPDVVALAAAAAVCFGVSLYATGHVSSRLPVAWVVLPPRLLGTLALTIPLALGGRLRLSRRAFPLVLIAGIC